MRPSAARRCRVTAAVLVALSSLPLAPLAAEEPAPALAEGERQGPAIGWNFDGVWLTPVLAPAYTPELGIMLSAGAMVSFKADAKSPRSSLPATIGYGSAGALVGSAILRSYFLEDRLRVDVDFTFKDMTDHYFGVGYDAGRNTELGDETTKYHRDSFQLEPTIAWRIGRNLFAAALLDLNQTLASDLNPRMAADPTVVADGTDSLNLGIGPVLRFDSRDFPQNAFHGVFAQASFVPYLSWKGNHDRYQVLDLDYRHYVTLGREGSTLTWNLRTRTAFGGVPWPELGQLGSPYDLRGYRWGRYRQRTIAYGILEYRLHFRAGQHPDGSPALGRHGIVGWVGAGTLGESFRTLDGTLPNAGVGYRFAVQSRLNVRFDLGVGRESQALYVNFTETY